MNVLSTHSPMLSWKMQFFPISPLQVVRFEKFQDKRRSLFWDKHFEYPQLYVILKIQDRRGSFLDECFEYPQPYVILKMQFLSHMSSPSSWIWKFLTRTGFFKTPRSPCLTGPQIPSPRPNTLDPRLHSQIPHLGQTGGQLIWVVVPLYKECITLVPNLTCIIWLPTYMPKIKFLDQGIKKVQPKETESHDWKHYPHTYVGGKTSYLVNLTGKEN